ncbi:MAG: hypothetical protein HYV63_29270 [Candidatus Schekmanbacteria bacterium]|nr:hypothetical protein [Candidatus Schekmanbacteria bacterium]
MAFIAEWNQAAHPFNGSTKSVAKVMAKCELPPSNPVPIEHEEYARAA